MEKLARSAKITIQVISGQEALTTGHEAARALWNFARYCSVGHNWKVRRWRGHWPWDIYKDRMPKFASGFDMQKELRDTDECRALSSRCYEYTIRELYANVKSWFSGLKSNPRARPPRYSKGPRQLTFEVGANAKPLGNWTYRLTVLSKNTKARHAVVELHVRPGVKMAQVKMIRVQPDGTGTIVYYTQSQERTGDGIAAVDLGIINLAVVAFQDGASIMYTGRGLLSAVQGLEKKAAKCKPSGYAGKGDAKCKPSKRMLAYRRKLTNIRKLACHNLTRNIIDECVARGVGTLVIGDLTGIREGKDWGKKNNQRLHAWPFAEIRRQLEYKAQEKGIEVIAISEAYTSKTCHFCGVIGKRVKRGKFVCKDCGIEINADVNGAFGILNKLYPWLYRQIDMMSESLGRKRGRWAAEADSKKKRRREMSMVNIHDKIKQLETLLNKVSPERVYASFGVVGNLPAQQSPLVETAGFCKIEPTIVAKFDLGNWSVKQTLL